MSRETEDRYTNLGHEMESQVIKAINMVIESNNDPKALLFGLTTKEPQAELEGHNLYLAVCQVCSANAIYIPMWIEFVRLSRATSIKWRIIQGKLPEDSVYNKAIMPVSGGI
jgi:hypothetical protein